MKQIFPENSHKSVIGYKVQIANRILKLEAHLGSAHPASICHIVCLFVTADWKKLCALPYCIAVILVSKQYF